jgi:hypothetical protein
MPITSNKISTTLQLKVKTGTDERGNDLMAAQSYRRVKASAMDSDLYAVAQSIGSLESTPVVSVIKADSFELINEA